MNEHLMDKLIGMNLSEATTILAQLNIKFRVVPGFGTLLTADFDTTRCNLHVDANDIVTDVDFG